MKLLSKAVALALACTVLTNSSSAQRQIRLRLDPQLAQDVRKVQIQLGKKQFAAAEKLFRQILNENKESPQVVSVQLILHQQFAAAYGRVKKHLEAGRHWASYTDSLIGRLEKTPQFAGAVSIGVGRFVGAFVAAKKPELAEDKLEQVLKSVRTVGDKTKKPSVVSLATAIQTSKVLMLAQQKQTGPAKELLAKLYSAKEKELKEKSNDEATITSMIYLKDARAKLATVTKSGPAEKYRKDLIEFVNAKAQTNSDSLGIVRQFVNLNLLSIRQAIYINPKKARKMLNEFEDRIDELASEDRRVQSQLNFVRNTPIPNYRKTIQWCSSPAKTGWPGFAAVRS